MALRLSIHFAYLVMVFFARFSRSAEGAIGMNWGRQNAQRLIPSMVVDLLLQNGIREARIYSSQIDILQAFVGSGINLTVSIFDSSIISTIDQAKQWAQKIGPYVASANIRRVYLGNHAFFHGLTDKPYLNSALYTLEIVQNALNDAGYGDLVKCTLPQPFNILKDNITKPSQAEFKDEIKQEMLRFLNFIRKNGSPFVIEFFPIHYSEYHGLDIGFFMCDNTSTHVVTDTNRAVYRNGFEYLFDSFTWALHKVGFPDLKIVVGQVGWPTDGHAGANASMAERFYKYLLPMVASNHGTPMRPGKPIDTYVHALTDEPKNPPSFPFARHWGIYESNGEPKYKIDLSGQGQDIFPARAKGIMRMPERWCVFDGNMTNKSKVLEQFDLACTKADCTSLAPGGSCSHINFHQNVSYGFNMFFQSTFQNEDACDFEGLGVVVTENPSTGSCVFPVEVVKGEQKQLAVKVKGDGGRLRRMPTCAPIFVCMLLWAMWVML